MNDAAATWKGTWGDRCCSPGAAVRLLLRPSLLSRSSTWEIYFCCTTGDAQTIPGNHRCHQTCHSHQPRAAGAAPRAQAALGCCLRDARQQKGAGRGLHRRGLSNPKMLPPPAGGEEGQEFTGGGSPGGTSMPRPLASPPASGPRSRVFQGATESRAPLEKGCHQDAHDSAMWVCLWGYRCSAADRTCWPWGWGGCGCFPPAEDTSQFVSVG